MPAWTIARLTLKEASRKKLLMALLGLTAFVIAFTVWGFSRLPTLTPRGQPITPFEVKAISSQLLILVMFMFSFVLALSAAFMAAPAVGAELESGIALAVLTRPISRLEYLLGKWLGLALLIAFYVAAASLIEFALVNAVTGYFPPDPAGFIAYMVAETLVLMTLTLLLSTRLNAMTGGIIALGAFGTGWVGGIASAIGAAFDNQAILNAGTVSKLLVPTDGLWHGAMYSLEPTAAISAIEGAGRGASTNPFGALNPPPVSFLLWTAAWLVIVFALAAYSLQRREV